MKVSEQHDPRTLTAERDRLQVSLNAEAENLDRLRKPYGRSTSAPSLCSRQFASL